MEIVDILTTCGGKYSLERYLFLELLCTSMQNYFLLADKQGSCAN